jgi:hypothetical protein
MINEQILRLGKLYLLCAVPVERIELPTFGLQNRCSTAELYRRPQPSGTSVRRIGQEYSCRLSILPDWFPNFPDCLPIFASTLQSQ